MQIKWSQEIAKLQSFVKKMDHFVKKIGPEKAWWNCLNFNAIIPTGITKCTLFFQHANSFELGQKSTCRCKMNITEKGNNRNGGIIEKCAQLQIPTINKYLICLSKAFEGNKKQKLINK